MKSKGNIVFLGMMGSGKTAVGRLVSKKLQIDFFDIDEHIEKSLRMKISKIFTLKGEKFFRQFEKKMTINILKKKNIVIALGGGAFLNKSIRQEILTNHTSFWLNLRSKTLIDRIKNSSKRPLASKATKDELINLIKKRSHFYSKALYKIDCNDLTKNEIVNKITDIYETDKVNN